jgi:hypothetical protein
VAFPFLLETWEAGFNYCNQKKLNLAESNRLHLSVDDVSGADSTLPHLNGANVEKVKIMEVAKLAASLRFKTYQGKAFALKHAHKSSK